MHVKRTFCCLVVPHRARQLAPGRLGDASLKIEAHWHAPNLKQRY